MIHRNVWRPDTCDCVITYEWDDAVPADQRVHTPTEHTPCKFHGGMATHDHYQVILDENRLKNVVHAKIVDQLKADHEAATIGPGAAGPLKELYAMNVALLGESFFHAQAAVAYNDQRKLTVVAADPAKQAKLDTILKNHLQSIGKPVV